MPPLYPQKPAPDNILFSNVIGGCSGSTGPSSINPQTGKPHGLSRYHDSRHREGPEDAARRMGRGQPNGRHAMEDSFFAFNFP
jgi:hypothetical protein